MKQLKRHYFIGLMLSILSTSALSAIAITSPQNGTAFTAGSSINVSVNASSRNRIDVVRLWVNGSVYALDKAAPYEFNVTGLPTGTHTLMARSKDSRSRTEDSQAITITVSSPSVTRITAPVNGTKISFGETFTVTAEAFDPDGIDGARLWIDGNYYALDSSAPYSFPVSGLAVGSHTLFVRTKDKRGNSLDSDTILINIENQTPYTRITSPANGTAFASGTNITVNAEAFDPDGISVARLWLDGNYHSLDSTAPYSFNVSGLAQGNHTLVVRTKDSRGNLLDSTPINIAIAASTTTPPPAPAPLPTPPPSSGAGISLPVEVLGPAGTRKSVSFNLDNTSNITHLYLQCHACGYHDIGLNKDTNKTKATVRINNGSPIALKHFTENGRTYGNSRINIIGGEANYGGIGGAFRTVRFTVPVSGLVRGQNTLTFEHLNAEAPSIGFRIIDLNLLQNGDISKKVLGRTEFINDDPSYWRAPSERSADIAEGERLWHQRNKLYDVWVDNLDGRGNRQGTVTGRIQASCADCHATDGRDLKYFNFSNLSIIERAKFHAMTQSEAEKVASYIRTLDIPVVDQARPWNPAYQPGPGLDSKPAYEWAAGAGIDAILDRDVDMAPYLFPRGTALNEVRAVVDRFDTLNFRELPVNIPMPEWNQWLPIIHPDDAFNTAASAIVSDNRGRNVGMPYYKKLFNDAMENPTPANLGGLSSGIKEWLRRNQTCSTSGLNSGEPIRGLNGAVLDSLRLPSPRVTSSNCLSINRNSLYNLEVAKRGLLAWASVKLWEVIHSQDLEEASQRVGTRVCSSGRCINASEARGWVADGRNVFDRPPHFTGVGEGRQYFDQNQMQGIFESNAWYHLNMILNPGYRQTMPSHFAYTYSHVELLQQYSDVDQGYRFWATLIKQRQLQTNGRYGVEEGLDLRTAQPYIYYGTARNRTNTETQSSVGQPLWGRLAQAMIEDFVEDANNATAQNWASATQNRKVQDRNSINFSACSGTCVFDLGAYQGRNTYRVIPELRRIGVGNDAINDLIDWGQKTWPRGPWNNLR
jgi:hypothetical protein